MGENFPSTGTISNLNLMFKAHQQPKQNIIRRVSGTKKFNRFFLASFFLQSPPNITVTATSTITNNNHHQSTPPPVNIKKYDLTGPFIKKDRRQVSSRFNVNKQNCEIESLPPLKGESSNSLNNLLHY